MALFPNQPLVKKLIVVVGFTMKILLFGHGCWQVQVSNRVDATQAEIVSS